MKYAFIERHEHEHSVRRMCLCLQVHPSGYYAWKVDPMSPRAQDDQRLLGLLKHAWLESGGVYGYRKLTLDMGDLGEICGKHRAAAVLRRCWWLCDSNNLRYRGRRHFDLRGLVASRNRLHDIDVAPEDVEEGGFPCRTSIEFGQEPTESILIVVVGNGDIADGPRTDRVSEIFEGRRAVRHWNSLDERVEHCHKSAGLGKVFCSKGAAQLTRENTFA
ncbi:hypothetical protein J2W36_000554 [Variovorax ginsengisoli]|uniref:HTH-like domain-containing protein n=1 Tax=Variovorax ginsengisoli TaxID=363844 RepID=A0ABT9S1T9_9BURK|nr:hypothetical protein [Variovorax ginsengisoli]